MDQPYERAPVRTLCTSCFETRQGGVAVACAAGHEVVAVVPTPHTWRDICRPNLVGTCFQCDPNDPTRKMTLRLGCVDCGGTLAANAAAVAELVQAQYGGLAAGRVQQQQPPPQQQPGAPVQVVSSAVAPTGRPVPEVHVSAVHQPKDRKRFMSLGKSPFGRRKSGTSSRDAQSGSGRSASALPPPSAAAMAPVMSSPALPTAAPMASGAPLTAQQQSVVSSLHDVFGTLPRDVVEAECRANNFDGDRTTDALLQVMAQIGSRGPSPMVTPPGPSPAPSPSPRADGIPAAFLAAGQVPLQPVSMTPMSMTPSTAPASPAVARSDPFASWASASVPVTPAKFTPFDDGGFGDDDFNPRQNPLSRSLGPPVGGAGGSARSGGSSNASLSSSGRLPRKKLTPFDDSDDEDEPAAPAPRPGAAASMDLYEHLRNLSQETIQAARSTMPPGRANAPADPLGLSAVTSAPGAPAAGSAVSTPGGAPKETSLFDDSWGGAPAQQPAGVSMPTPAPAQESKKNTNPFGDSAPGMGMFDGVSMPTPAPAKEPVKEPVQDLKKNTNPFDDSAPGMGMFDGVSMPTPAPTKEPAKEPAKDPKKNTNPFDDSAPGMGMFDGVSMPTPAPTKEPAKEPKKNTNPFDDSAPPGMDMFDGVSMPTPAPTKEPAKEPKKNTNPFDDSAPADASKPAAPAQERPRVESIGQDKYASLRELAKGMVLPKPGDEPPPQAKAKADDEVQGTATTSSATATTSDAEPAPAATPKPKPAPVAVALPKPDTSVAPPVPEPATPPASKVPLFVVSPPPLDSNPDDQPLWIELQTKDAHSYYVNRVTRETTWEWPVGSVKPFAPGSAWVLMRTDEGHPYYYNFDNGQSSWQKPDELVEQQQKAAAAAAAATAPGGAATTATAAPESPSKAEQGPISLKPAAVTYSEEKRMESVWEIVQTEETYVSYLELVIKEVMQPLATKKIVPEADLKVIFSSLEVIVSFNRDLATRLQERLYAWAETSGEDANKENSIKADLAAAAAAGNTGTSRLRSLSNNKEAGTSTLSLGDIFLELAPFMKVYTAYVNNYPHAMAVLHKHRQNERLYGFLKNALGNTKFAGLDLPSLLIMPIQRVPRYVLLLKNLVKQTSPVHQDYRRLSTALQRIEEVADHVNKSKAQQENREQVLKIQDAIQKSLDKEKMPLLLIDAARWLIKQGPLSHQAPKRVGLKTREVFLFNDLLLIAKRVDEARGTLNFKAVIYFKDVVAVKPGAEQGSLQVQLNSSAQGSVVHLFVAPSQQAADEWRTQMDQAWSKLRSSMASRGQPSAADNDESWMIVN